MKKINFKELANAPARKSIEADENPYYLDKWEDEYSNNFVFADYASELQAIAPMVAARAILSGKIIEAFFEGAPFNRRPVSMPPVDAEEFNMYNLTDRSRKNLTFKHFGSSGSQIRYISRPNSDGGISVGFSFDPSYLTNSRKSHIFNTNAKRWLEAISADNLSSYLFRGMSNPNAPDYQLRLKVLQWYMKRYPYGRAVTLSFPLDELIGDILSMADDDGNPYYGASFFRSGSAKLTVRVENRMEDRHYVSLRKDDSPPELWAKTDAAINGKNLYSSGAYLDINEILQWGDPFEFSKVFAQAFEFTHIEFMIEVDMNAEETAFITKGNGSVSRAGMWAKAVVESASDESDVPYYFNPFNFSSSVTPRVGLNSCLVSPYNLLPMYIPLQDNSKEFEKTLEEYYVNNGGVYDNFNINADKLNPDEISNEELLRSLKEGHSPLFGVIGVDWVSNRLFYSTGKGIESTDINDYASLRPYHYFRMLNEKCYSKSPFKVNIPIGRIYSFMLSNSGKQYVSQEALDALEYAMFDLKFGGSLERLWDSYAGEVRYSGFRNSRYVLGEPYTPEMTEYFEAVHSGTALMEDLGKLRELRLDSPVPFNRGVALVIRDFVKAVDSDFNMVGRKLDYTMTNYLQLVGFAKTWLDLSSNEKALTSLETNPEAAGYGRQPEEFGQIADEYKPEALPNLRKDLAFMPHQAKVSNSLALNAKLNILSVDAGGGKCLTGNALVPTNKGLLRMDEIFHEQALGTGKERALDGLKVLTKAGVKSADGAYITKGVTHKVRLSNGSRIEGLPEHKLWVFKDGELKFVRLDNVEVGDALPNYARTGLFGDSVSLEHLELGASPKAVTEAAKRGVTIPKVMTEELAELLGWVVSEGSGTCGNIITQHDEKSLNRIYNLACSVFGKGGVKKGDVNISFLKLPALFLNALAGTGLSKDRFIPKEVRMAPRSMVVRFLSSLFEGDGTIYVANKGTTDNPKFGGYNLEYNTISKELAQEVLVMLGNLGIEATVLQSETYMSQGGLARVFTVNVNRASHSRFEQEVGFISKRKRKLLRTAVKYRQSVEGTTNDEVFGSENMLPFGNEVNTLYRELDEAMRQIKLETARVSRSGNVSTLKFKGGLVHLHALAKSNGETHRGKSGTRYIFGLNKGGWTNRWTLARLNACYDHMPAKAKRHLDKTFAARLSALNELAQFSWLSVALSKKGNKEKQVYDICVPEHHEYSVQTIMSHNTLLVITDIIRKLKDGICKVPAVFCPGHLLSNYVEDANYGTDGKFNVIPLKTETYNRLGKEYFEKVARGKPTNTFFVIDYDFVGQEWDSTVVGTDVVGYYPRAQWLRSLGIDAVWLDEGHYLKNASTRTSAMREALVDVKYITLATGTFYANKAADIINQTMVLDPALFGYESTFDGMYGLGITLNDTTREVVNRTLNSGLVVCRAKRREWAALLPDRSVKFHMVSLSKRARTVYEAVLKATLEDIKKDPVIMKLLNGNDGSEEREAQLEGKLQQYLQRLEKVITCPYEDELWQEEWGIDSPKLNTLIGICRSHFKNKVKGKILIFCSYHSSVNAIYDNLPPDLKAMTLRYSAKTKARDRERFANDPNIHIMIGIENSMNTGINAQFASRLIRVDSVFSPGQLEQGESRICRPNVKVKEFREHLYFDWILGAETYDSFKTARLISKVLDTEKFNNMYEPAYAKLIDLPVLRLNFNAIADSSGFDGDLSTYLEQYMLLENEVKVNDVKDFRKRNPNLQHIPVKSKGLLEGSALMKHVPYIPLGGLPSSDITGQMSSISETFMNMVYEDERNELIGRTVHTEYGEGVLKRINKDTVRVEIPKVGSVSLDQGAVYLMPEGKATTSTKGIRRHLAERVDLNLVDGLAVTDEQPEPVNPEPPEPAEEVEHPKPKSKKLKEIKEEPKPEKEIKNVEVKVKSPVPQDSEDGQVDMYPTYLNEFYAIGIDSWTDWEEQTGNDLSEYGFKPSQPSIFMELKRWQHCRALREAWNESGFLAPKSFYDTLTYLQEAMKRNRAEPVSYRHLSRSVKDLMVWSLDRRRKVKSDRAKPYFAIQDGAVYVMIDMKSTPAWQKIKSTVRVPGTKWLVEDDARWFITPKRTELVNLVKTMIKDGVPIADLDWVKETITGMKNVTR